MTTDLLLVSDEEEDLLEAYVACGIPLAWLVVRQPYTKAVEDASVFVLRDEGGELTVVPEIKRRCAEGDYRILYVSGTTEENVPYAVRLAEALGVRGPCPTGALEFFYDKLEMRRRIGRHPLNIDSWAPDNLAGLSGGPFVVKPRRGQSSIGVASCADRSEVERIVSTLGDPDEWVVERKVEGMEFVLDGFLFEGVFRLTGLHITYTGGRIEGVVRAKESYANPFIECAHLSGPIFDRDFGLSLAEQFGELLVSQGITYGMFHSEFRLDGTQPKLIESHPRPGGCMLPLVGELSGCHSLGECYTAVMRRDPPPPVCWPSSWVYQRYLKKVDISPERWASLSRSCPGIELLPMKPSAPAVATITQTNDWDTWIRARAATREEIGRQMWAIEALVEECTRG